AIRTDGGTQIRAKLDANTINEYAEAMKAKAQFPAIILYADGINLWLADGFHRYRAAHTLVREEILAEVRQGTRIDALRHALGANVTNGLRRSNADKRRVVVIALEAFSDYADRLLGDMCCVSHTLVSDCRRQLAAAASCSSGTTAQ